MDKEKLISVLKFYRSQIEEKKDVSVSCIFVDKNNNRKKKYYGYPLNCSIELVRDSLLETLELMINRMIDSDMEHYDYMYDEDGVIQYLGSDEVFYSEQILETISENLNDRVDLISDEAIISKLDFVILRLYSIKEGVKPLYLFKRCVKASTKFKSSVKFTFEGGVPKLFKKPMLMISDWLDVFLYEDRYYIFDRDGFNSIFNYKDGFHMIVDSGYNMIEQSDIFADPREFVLHCKENGRHLPRLAKIIASDGFLNLKENKNNLKKVKERYNLSININEKNQIIYEDKKDIPEILNLLLDHYVNSALSERAMLAKAIEKYSV